MAQNSRKRFLSYSMFFDTTANNLSTEISDEWSDEAKKNFKAARERTRTNIVCHFGAVGMEEKIANFAAVGAVPFSFVSYHNAFFLQARSAFVIGNDYPALCSICALGERMLNHMVHGLKDDFKTHPLYKKVYRKKSFDDWDFMIDLLDEWKILLPEVCSDFRKLKALRHKSIHFSTSTYETLHEDALNSIRTISRIMEQQFGVFGRQPWLIEGTAGFAFIKKEYESNPFVRRFIIPRCPLVGERFSIKFNEHMQPVFFDIKDYDATELTDQEFIDLFKKRDQSKLAEATPDLIVAVGIPTS